MVTTHPWFPLPFVIIIWVFMSGFYAMGSLSDHPTQPYNTLNSFSSPSSSKWAFVKGFFLPFLGGPNLAL